MSDFKAKMLGSLQLAALPRPLAGLQRPTSKERREEGCEGRKGWERKGKGREG